MIHNLFEVKMSHSSADDGLDFGALLTCPMPNLCKAKLFTNLFYTKASKFVNYSPI